MSSEQFTKNRIVFNSLIDEIITLPQVENSNYYFDYFSKIVSYAHKLDCAIDLINSYRKRIERLISKAKNNFKHLFEIYRRIGPNEYIKDYEDLNIAKFVKRLDMLNERLEEAIAHRTTILKMGVLFLKRLMIELDGDGQHADLVFGVKIFLEEVIFFSIFIH